MRRINKRLSTSIAAGVVLFVFRFAWAEPVNVSECEIQLIRDRRCHTPRRHGPKDPEEKLNWDAECAIGIYNLAERCQARIASNPDDADSIGPDLRKALRYTYRGGRDGEIWDRPRERVAAVLSLIEPRTSEQILADEEANAVNADAEETADTGGNIIGEVAGNAASSAANAAKENGGELGAPGDSKFRNDRPDTRDRSAGPVEDLDSGASTLGSDTQSRTMRSLARVESGNLKGALEDAKMVLDRDPNNQVARSIYDYASRSMDGGNAKGQKPNFAVMLEDGLKGPDPSRLTGQGSHQGHELFKGGLRSMTLSQTLAASARHKMELGDLKGALLAASQAIGADPQNTQAYSSRAAILNKMGNYEGAKLDATRAIALDPKSTNALNERSWAHNQLKQFLPALQDADASLAIDAAQAVAHLNKAIALEGLGKYKEALEAFKAASDLDPALMAFYEDAVDKYGAQVGWTDRPKKKVSRILRQRLGPLGSALPLAGLGALGLVLAYALFKALRRVNDEPMPGQGTNGHAKTMVMPQAQVRPSDVATIAATTLAGPPSSTPTIATPSSNTAGRLIAGNFQIIRELGRGGMGVVYEGKDITLARTVAIKQMRPEIRQSSKETERFLSEARLVASLKHPNLAEIYSILQDSGDLFLVFEYISGKGLDKLMDEKPRLSPKETNNILQDVSKALDYAHSKKIIHRDLKPSNIMVTEDNQAKVMDFGIAHQAKLTVSKLTSAGMWGTPAYMPPEQEMGLASKESDLYALAVMTYEMLTGEIPFAGPNFLHQKQRCMYKPASELVPELPKALDQFFQRALNPEPQERFHGGAELLHAFQKAL